MCNSSIFLQLFSGFLDSLLLLLFWFPSPLFILFNSFDSLLEREKFSHPVDSSFFNLFLLISSLFSLLFLFYFLQQSTHRLEPSMKFVHDLCTKDGWNEKEDSLLSIQILPFSFGFFLFLGFFFFPSWIPFWKRRDDVMYRNEEFSLLPLMNPMKEPVFLSQQLMNWNE